MSLRRTLEGDGTNRWAVVHRSDAARALGLDKAPAGARLHALAEEGIGIFFGMELTATSAATRALLGWTPQGPTLIEDLDAGAYSEDTKLVSQPA